MVAAVSEAKRRMLPVPGPDSIFEHVLMGELLVAKTPQVEVLIVKTEKKYVHALLDLFNLFPGSEINFIAPVCYTLLYLFPQHSEEMQKDTAFIDIGYDFLNITIAQRGHLYFNRNIKFGLREMIAHIAESLDISSEKAEDFVYKGGVPPVPEDLKADSQEGSSLADVQIQKLRISWETIFHRILHEIRRTGTHYKEQSAGKRIENFFFLGGGSRIKGLVSNLVPHIGGDCKILKPAQEMDISPNNQQSPLMNDEEWPIFVGALSIAMGLPIVKQKQTINFLPWELKRKDIIAYRQLGLFFFSLVILSLLGIASAGLFLNNQFLKGSIHKMEEEIKPYSSVLERFEQLRREKEKRMAEISGIKKISLERMDMASWLDGIVRYVPQKVYLTKLSIEEKKTDSLSAPPKADPAGKSTAPPLKGMGGAEKEGSASMNTGDRTSRQESSAAKQYTVEIQAVCMTDYEEVLRLAQEFKTGLEQSAWFINVALTLPKLETIVPVIDSQDVQLTQPRMRKFSLKAEFRKENHEGL